MNYVNRGYRSQEALHYTDSLIPPGMALSHSCFDTVAAAAFPDNAYDSSRHARKHKRSIPQSFVLFL